MLKEKTAIQIKRERDMILTVFNPKARFNAERFFTALRIAGQNPRLERLAPGHTHFARNVNCEQTSTKRALANAALDWAFVKDPAGIKQKGYILDMMGLVPSEPTLFELQLGCDAAC